MIQESYFENFINVSLGSRFLKSEVTIVELSIFLDTGSSTASCDSLEELSPSPQLK